MGCPLWRSGAAGVSDSNGRYPAAGSSDLRAEIHPILSSSYSSAMTVLRSASVGKQACCSLMRGNSMGQEPIYRILLTGTAQVKGPSRRVPEIHPGRTGRAQTSRIHIQPHPIRNDHESCQRHDQPTNAPCQALCRVAASHRQVQAGVPIAGLPAPQDATRRSQAARWSSREGDPQAPRAPTPQQFLQRSMGASSVTERVTEWRSAKRTRTVTVRPGLDLARSRVATRSARWRSVGR